MLIVLIGKPPRDVEQMPSMSFPQRLNHLSHALSLSMITNAKDMASFASQYWLTFFLWILVWRLTKEKWQVVFIHLQVVNRFPKYSGGDIFSCNWCHLRYVIFISSNDMLALWTNCPILICYFPLPPHMALHLALTAILHLRLKLLRCRQRSTIIVLY